jgi:hypothetical protein
MNEGKIAALKEESESLRFANAVYWKRVKDHSRQATVELHAGNSDCNRSRTNSRS